MLKHRNITLERFDKFVSPAYFRDVNLLSQLWKRRLPAAVSLAVYSVPGDNRIPFAEAARAEYRPAKTGDAFGPSWTTHWFRVKVAVPGAWRGDRVFLVLDSNSEGLLWTADGAPLQGFTGGKGGDRHVEYLLADEAKGGEEFSFFYEMACNGMFGCGEGINAPDPNRTFTFETAEIAAPNKDVFALFYDFQIIAGIAKDAPSDSQVAANALYTANAIVNAFHPDEPESWKAARMISTEFLKTAKSSKDHAITAIGHCHIDTAWLWPYDETKRKCARSWSTQCGLMDMYPEHKFACSQAQQFEWMLELYPQLFERIKAKVDAGQFIPIGGTWVEMDCNVPSGEALCRQFLYGQRFFETHFGKRCEVFWLPDTFGYASQLPQIVCESDMKYFFTQKLSWNNINKFPNHTFYWEGLDGSRVLVHFSPTDTYNAQCTAKEMMFTVQNNKDKEYSDKSLLLFGNGDGGGGPLPSMLERLRRVKDISGLPAVSIGCPNDFFHSLETTSRDLVTWRGELYFELHRGTYTSQASTKRFNRKLEILLQNAEKLGTIATMFNDKYAYDKALLDHLWKLLLLNQFHDVLPGSSIGMVYVDALKFYAEIEEKGTALCEAAFKLITDKAGGAGSGKSIAVMNLNSHARRVDLVEVAEDSVAKQAPQISADGKHALHIVDSVPGLSVRYFDLEYDIVEHPVLVTSKGDSITVENRFIKVTFDKHARISSFVDKRASREIIPEGELANRFVFFEDVPLFWDNWDVEVYHLEKRWESGVGIVEVLESGPVRVTLGVTHPLSATSSLEMRITITAVSPMVEFDCKAKWNENRKILKVEMPVNIMSDTATYETAGGILTRPTHSNTSWDMAKFEVCGHRFMDLSEHGYGVALINDCKYGHSCHKNVMRISLIRAPKAPDDHCDIGDHVFKYALYPHAGAFNETDVVAQAAFFNNPLRARVINSPKPAPEHDVKQFFKITAGNLILDAVKSAEGPLHTGSAPGPARGHVILRLYETYGGRGTATLSSHWDIKKAAVCNILEDEKRALEVGADGKSVSVRFTPFQIITIKLVLDV